MGRKPFVARLLVRSLVRDDDDDDDDASTRLGPDGSLARSER
jgi:hypothetical protein